MSEYQLSLESISFKADEQIILDSVSFKVKKGERITITGPSGGGKSTLLKIIASIINPTQGTVYFNGEDIQESDPLPYRQKVAYFFQNATLFDQTVRDNVSFPYEIREKEFDEEKCTAMLERVKLDRSYLDKPIKDLSGGEKQRVALVRNLLFQPEVLLLDEVTSSLDAENKEIIYSMLDELNEKESITILSVTHDEREIDKADRVLTITNGKLEDSE
ncbi:ABC transporter ATP-binding protein [Alkalibacterium olivapovliticus]|uniref:Putative ABC transport system ATP-binding protein n=1 Tax=Alkalibacterium olivapovliticus TaxID=99907 RepID=A0A2T0WA80_9LACT|nr:ATP-binding cassette domain-containing protein [Alkalibacterium olivapovliticus]PRY83424.1 putative ABC transport system ATP-binding protein [Alkalibacterium olivapovliticus]